MTAFADQLMVRYTDPANVDLLLVPQSDTTRQRAQALLASVYQPQLLTVQSLDSITVTAQSFQVPVVEPMPFNGTWEKITPQSERSLISFDLPAIAQTDWIGEDLVARPMPPLEFEYSEPQIRQTVQTKDDLVTACKSSDSCGVGAEMSFPGTAPIAAPVTR